jgi:hypothetical protein
MSKEAKLVCAACGKGERHLTRLVQQQNPDKVQWVCDECLKHWQQAHPDDADIPLEEAPEDLKRAYAPPKEKRIVTPDEFAREAVENENHASF